MVDIRRSGCKTADICVGNANNSTSPDRAYEVGDIGWVGTNLRVQLCSKLEGQKAENYKQRSVFVNLEYDYTQHISRAGVVEACVLQFSDGQNSAKKMRRFISYSQFI